MQNTGVIKERLFPIPGGVGGKVVVRSAEMFFLLKSRLDLDLALSGDERMVGYTSGGGAASSDGNLARTKKKDEPRIGRIWDNTWMQNKMMACCYVTGAAGMVKKPDENKDGAKEVDGCMPPARVPCV